MITHHDDVDDVAAKLMRTLADRLSWARRLYPGDDYAARIYRCEPCGSLDGCVAPAEELLDDYPCPSCGRPQHPVTGIGEPPPNRMMRRRTRSYD